ncbi:hypothetical protein [Haloterrigena turkmenica]|uniref:hypothetical protein n=1 Tax=Haloterrigena turkmenica TaxID=62320 RepID=UPI000B13F233|nr:hypothetical protein [Haloterrigena turkmenica]
MAVLGDCLFEFVEVPPEDELTFRVQRAVESDVKCRDADRKSGEFATALKVIQLRKADCS